MAIGRPRTSVSVFLATIVIFTNQVWAQDVFIILDFTVTAPAPNSGNTSFESGSPTDTTMYAQLYTGENIDATGDPLFIFNLTLATSSENAGANYISSLDFSDADYDNMKNALVDGDQPTFNPLASINIPLAACDNYTHLCLRLASYPNGDTEYDVNCIEFGDGEALAGIKECIADVYATSMEVTSPTSQTYTVNEVNEIYTSISISNQGFDISAADSGSENYNVTCYLSNTTDIDSSEAQYLTFEGDLASASNLGAALATDGTLIIEGVGCDIVIPSDQCDQYNYLCLGVTPSTNYTTYTDANSTNNYACLLFGEVSEGYAGVLECPDLAVLEYEISGQSSLTYDSNTNNEISFTAKVANNGTIDIAAATNGDNFEFTCIVTDKMNLEDGSARTTLFDALTSSDTTNLDAGIDGDSYIEIENVKCDIYINSSYCEVYTHLCVSVGVASGADYAESNTENNYYCLEFGKLEDGYAGVLCAGCMVSMNYLVFFTAALLTQIFGHY